MYIVLFMNKKTLNSQEVSNHLKISRSQVQTIILKGLIKPVSSIHPYYLFDAKEINEYKRSLK